MFWTKIEQSETFSDQMRRGFAKLEGAASQDHLFIEDDGPPGKAENERLLYWNIRISFS